MKNKYIGSDFDEFLKEGEEVKEDLINFTSCGSDKQPDAVEHTLSDKQEDNQIEINDEYIKSALLAAADNLIIAGKTIQPFNDMYAMSLFKQAELMVENLAMFEESIDAANTNINSVNVPDNVKEEIDSLVDSLKGTLGDL